MKFEIYAGLGGGFGGASYIEIIEVNTREEAEEYARQCAIDDYESYEGSHGILSRDDVFEDLLESFGEEPSEKESEQILEGIKERYENYHRVITITTRSMREGEVNGDDSLR